MKCNVASVSNSIYKNNMAGSPSEGLKTNAAAANGGGGHFTVECEGFTAVDNRFISNSAFATTGGGGLLVLVSALHCSCVSLGLGLHAILNTVLASEMFECAHREEMTWFELAGCTQPNGVQDSGGTTIKNNAFEDNQMYGNVSSSNVYGGGLGIGATTQGAVIEITGNFFKRNLVRWHAL